jgi:hypothetical protein
VMSEMCSPDFDRKWVSDPLISFGGKSLRRFFCVPLRIYAVLRARLWGACGFGVGPEDVGLGQRVRRRSAPPPDRGCALVRRDAGHVDPSDRGTRPGGQGCRRAANGFLETLLTTGQSASMAGSGRGALLDAGLAVASHGLVARLDSDHLSEAC